ncbi:hypothetical protein JW796_04215 [Candidatus Dojkabacteria bacterium]|nr:hypothetical protein [Candidatus Dojkabacteria bacterium]
MKAVDFFGSVYSRDPLTGERKPSGNLYAFDGKTTLDIKELDKKLVNKLKRILRRLERRMHFVAEVFIVYKGSKNDFEIKLKKRAKIESYVYPKILIDLLEEKIISEKELLKILPLDMVKEWFASRIVKEKQMKKLCSGRIISYGAGKGKILKDRKRVEQAIERREQVVWVVDKVSSDDLRLFSRVNALVLTKSGPTSHAAVVAKALGIPAILGCRELLLKKYDGKNITVDANEGNVYAGTLSLTSLAADEELKRILNIAERYSKITVSANADTANDAMRAINLGVNGIGLCRTEHMFLNKERSKLIRQILFVDKPLETSLDKLKEIQEKDFFKLFKVESGNEVIVRYLDAPLHEFMGENYKDREENPMLGMRGARMLLKKTEIIKVQTRAIFSALLRLDSKGEKVKVGLEIPFVMDASEVKAFKSIVHEEIKKLDPDGKIYYEIGAMIEVPRAAYLIEEIAGIVDFISFGTNDLTQMMLGLSRDDAGSFIDYYVEKRFLPADPFVSLDQSGVGKLIEETSKKARRVNKKIKISVCGEQAGDPFSIQMLMRSNIDSISCSSSVIPMVLLASGKFSL